MHGDYAVATVDGNSNVDMAGGVGDLLNVVFDSSSSPTGTWAPFYAGQAGNGDVIDFGQSVVGLNITLSTSAMGLVGTVTAINPLSGGQNAASFKGFDEIKGSSFGDLITISNCNGEFFQALNGFTQNTSIITKSTPYNLGSNIAIDNATNFDITSYSLYDQIFINNEALNQSITWESVSDAYADLSIAGSLCTLGPQNRGSLLAVMKGYQDSLITEAGDQTFIDCTVAGGNHLVNLHGETAKFRLANYDVNMPISLTLRDTVADISQIANLSLYFDGAIGDLLLQSFDVSENQILCSIADANLHELVNLQLTISGTGTLTNGIAAASMASLLHII